MKNWKRIAALAMSAVMVGGMLTGCGGGGGSTEAAKDNAPKAEAGAEAGKDEGGASADSGEKKQVYVFIRDRGDLSYWDSMAAGGDRSVTDYADRADVHVVETTADLQANLQAMYEAADKGADLIITASDFKDNLVEVANEYPDIAFTIISEDVIDQCENNNAYGVDFATSQAAFLGGIAAADIAANGAEGMDPTNVIGFIGGMDESLVIQEFLWGYIQGAKYYNPDVKIVYNYVGAWNDPDTAKTQAMTQYNDAGADVIFACAGGSGNGAVSLFVAAIGIANTMMMSIYERTKEIGVIKVLGCSLRNIKQMFLLEAAFIGFIGGLVGNILSFLISFAINAIVTSSGAMGVEGNISYIPFWLAAASMIFAVFVGMAAGYFPALRAMRLSPLAAIHNE